MDITSKQHTKIEAIHVAVSFFLVLSYIAVTPSHLFATTEIDTLLIHQQVGNSVVPPPPPPPPPSSPGGGGGVFIVPEFSITNVRTDVHTMDVVVSWTTSVSSTAVLTWGTEGMYGKGQSTEVMSTTEHAMLIEGLSPGTQYAVSLRATDIYGRVVTVEGVLLRTERLPDSVPPANVSDFMARYQDEGVILSWNNPIDHDFERVRVVRSDMFFPEDPYDGLVVYEGRKESARDTWIDPRVTYYYTAFAEDDVGNYSSGTVAKIRIPSMSGGEQEEVPLEGSDVFGGISIISGGGDVPQEIKELTFADFHVFQFGVDLPKRGNVLTLDTHANWEIALPYSEVPEVLKTIGITLADPDDPSKTFPFLLRANADKTAYVATLAPLSRPGVYRVSATVLDYKHQVLKQFEGKLIVPGEIPAEDVGFVGVCGYCFSSMTGLKFLQCYGWIGLLIIFGLLIVGRKKKETRHIVS